MSDGWLAVRFMHVVAVTFFVGGQLFLAAIVVPVERRNPDREPLRAVARRFGVGTLAVIGGGDLPVVVDDRVARLEPRPRPAPSRLASR